MSLKLTDEVDRCLKWSRDDCLPWTVCAVCSVCTDFLAVSRCLESHSTMFATTAVLHGYEDDRTLAMVYGEKFHLLNP